MTERAGEAFDVMSSITNMELNSYDGVVAVVRTCLPSLHSDRTRPKMTE